MSGGHFDYSQYKITEIADEIQSKIDKNGTEIPEKERWNNQEWYEKYPDDKFYRNYPDEILNEFKEAIRILRKAAVYAQRVDWLLSGDDGEESFLMRLKEELSELKK